MKQMITFFIFILAATAAFADAYHLKLKGMHCMNCVETLKDKLEKEYGGTMQNLNINLETKTVTFDSISIDMEEVKKKIETIGFEVTSAKKTKP